jgi:tetrahydromethanopterin S-methyltransferase subunit C
LIVTTPQNSWGCDGTPVHVGVGVGEVVGTVVVGEVVGEVVGTVVVGDVVGEVVGEVVGTVVVGDVVGEVVGDVVWVGVTVGIPVIARLTVFIAPALNVEPCGASYPLI